MLPIDISTNMMKCINLFTTSDSSTCVQSLSLCIAILNSSTHDTSANISTGRLLALYFQNSIIPSCFTKPSGSVFMIQSLLGNQSLYT